MKLLLLPLLLASLSAQASIFNLDDDTLDIIPVSPAQPAVVPAKPVPQPPEIRPEPAKPAPAPLPVPAAQPAAPLPKVPAVPTATTAQKTSPFTAQFPLYQSAHAAYLRNDYKAAFPAFGRLLALAKQQKTESPFTLCARLLREKMRLAAGDAKDRAQALKNLAKFADNPQAGPFRADALRLLVKERLEAVDFRGTKPWLGKLSLRIAEARAAVDARKAEQAVFLDALTPEIQAQVIPPASPWQAHPDIFGHVARCVEAPGQVVHAACAPWHLGAEVGSGTEVGSGLELTPSGMGSDRYLTLGRGLLMTNNGLTLIAIEAARYGVRADALAEAIPALSNPSGSNKVERFGNRNQDLQEMQDGWPPVRTQTFTGQEEMKHWLHSDTKDVAYKYNHRLFEDWITQGGLK